MSDNLLSFKAIIFDCYGTLCDWESGIYNALQPLLARYPDSAGKWTRKEALLAFTEIEKDLQAKDPTVLYRDLLANAYTALNHKLAQSESTIDIERESAAFGASIKDWAIFQDTYAALRVLQKHYKLVILSNVDYTSFAHTHTKLSGAPESELAAYTRPSGSSQWLPHGSNSPFSLILTAQDTGAYKPDPKGMRSALEIIQREFGVEPAEVLVVAQSLYHDINPSSELGITGIWIDRAGAVMGLESIDETPKWRWSFKTLGEIADKIEVQALATPLVRSLHPQAAHALSLPPPCPYMSSSRKPTATTTPSPSFTAAAITGAPHANALAFVYHIDIFLLALAATLVFYRSPRAFARLWRLSEWSNGHLLRYRQPRTPPSIVVSRGSLRRNNHPTTKELDSELSHSHVRHAHRVNSRGGSVQVAYPPHVASTMTLLRPLISPLSTRISPGFTFAQVLVLLVYMSVLIYPLSVATPGPFVDLDRTAWIATSQLPVVILFASKNNVLGMLLGESYESLNFLHRFAARAFVLCCNAHGLGYIFQWCQEGVFKTKIRIFAQTHGLLALTAVNMLFFFSTSFFRAKYYRLFVNTHLLGLATLLPGLWFHKTRLRPFIYVALGFYALDHALRLLKTRTHIATLRPLADMGVTRIEIPQITAGWRAGQHVRIRVLTGALGVFGWAESHPFTIASMSGAQEGLVLMAKKSGDWTTKLFDFAKSGGFTAAGVGRNVRVVVEGPYGGPGHAMFNSYSSAVFIVGGSGISFALSAIEELVDQDLRGQCRVKVIELIWTLQDPAALLPLYTHFNTLIERSVFTRIRISVFYTRAPIGKFPFAESAFPTTNLTLSPGRPRFLTMLENSIGRTVKLGAAGGKDEERLTGILVAVCGPTSLADSVVEAVGKLEPLRKDQVGGVEVHEEVFGF
ncbi:Iron reductase [Mycena indigotica]|uniref:ferric-chelate reductase (NADPH) n=1 Tax=Mycena indigotica TaxID=2126181 RepID=A0A8H6SQV6_9AGAR|nr:Iron reductase [Mycena indigotica]KAF7303754.1 Iron reductase [Mycena indigotica]